MRFKNSNQRKAVMAKFKLKKGYYISFGKGKIKEGKKQITATTFNGKNVVRIYYPKSPSNKIKNQVKNFLLNELDDHEAYKRFIKQ